jgi:hypothetical protein
MHCFGYRSCEASVLHHWTHNDVWECFGALHYPLTGKKMQNLCLSLNALFWGTEVVKHPFYSIRPKLMFGIVSEHFANLQQVKTCKTFVWGLNALFWSTEVVKHPFYSIGPKLMFGSVSEHFAKLRQVKRCKTFVPSLNALFWGTNVVKHLHWTQNDVWDCFSAFR